MSRATGAGEAALVGLSGETVALGFSDGTIPWGEFGATTGRVLRE
jgi:hypothetical protein